MVYVDDLLITCASQDAINELANQLRAEYGEIKLQQEMDMSYIENVLQEYPVKTSVSTPANNNLFSSPGKENPPRHPASSDIPLHQGQRCN